MTSHFLDSKFPWTLTLLGGRHAQVIVLWPTTTTWFISSTIFWREYKPTTKKLDQKPTVCGFTGPAPWTRPFDGSPGRTNFCSKKWEQHGETQIATRDASSQEWSSEMLLFFICIWIWNIYTTYTEPVSILQDFIAMYQEATLFQQRWCSFDFFR